MDYEKAAAYFQDDRLRELALSRPGLRFLKIRSLARRELMRRLIDEHGLDVGNSAPGEWLKQIYDSNLSDEDIDRAILDLYELGRSERRKTEERLLNELYKVKTFDWGGLHQNSLEKTIVNNYVKKIDSYGDLNDAIENRLQVSMRAYVLASWYNHWSSISIEDIFKDNPKVIPAVGLVKKIDFFINDKPFDLKATYLPEGYVKDRRKLHGLRPELTLLKKMCRNLNIGFEQASPAAVLSSDLWQKLDDHPEADARGLVKELRGFRGAALDEATADPECLIRWLYENQGTRRFDASNRLFLILADRNDSFGSWKLKKAKALIQKEVNRHLGAVDDFGTELAFEWKGEEYVVESGAIFVIKH